ncbi:MAG: bifunctional diaminohydroxyphosphoribosylaminopyrimidine deaminase/5-amino-6-(5-phosphoribosylamino)uracil reductase RibD [Verrucomicrobiota bacterium]
MIQCREPSIHMITEEDNSFMQQALELAAAVDPAKTDPNPRVGCVIVSEDQVVATGAHLSDGGPHAEVEAFNALGGKRISEGTLYVTLEPCSTAGRTGACCQRIIESGMIDRVVIGAIDPNPHHRGKAIELLKQSGIQVEPGCLADQCEALNPEFNRRMAD